VYKSFDESKNHAECAVKVIPASKLLENEEQYALFMREIEVLRQIKGDNIVHLLDVKRTPNNLYIFTDYCNGGDLEKMLKKTGPLGEEKALSVLKQIVNAFIGLDNLIVKNHKGAKVAIMHRDIKPPNILFNDGVVKIADFGFAKIVDENNKNVKLHHTLLGTPLYMNPQTLNDEAYTYKCDIWSTGVVFFECIFGRLPWTASSIVMLLRNIKDKGLDFPRSINEDTKDLLRKMLTMKEESRIDWKGISEHPAIIRAKLPGEFTSPPKARDEDVLQVKPTPVAIRSSPRAGANPVSGDLKSHLPSPYNNYIPLSNAYNHQASPGSTGTTNAYTQQTSPGSTGTTNAYSHQSPGSTGTTNAYTQQASPVSTGTTNAYTHQASPGTTGTTGNNGSYPTTGTYQPSGGYKTHLPDKKY